jgi:hypothetical protein
VGGSIAGTRLTHLHLNLNLNRNHRRRNGARRESYGRSYAMTRAVSSLEIASALFALRMTLSAARAALSFDRAIAYPLPDELPPERYMIPPLWRRGGHDAQYALALPLLSAADEKACELVAAGENRYQSELGAIAVEIRKLIAGSRQSLACHQRNGDDEAIANALNTGRHRAGDQVDVAWNLTALAIRSFVRELLFRAVPL